IGLLMHLIFRKDDSAKAESVAALPEEQTSRPLWQNAVYLAAMVGVLVFANWSRPEHDAGLWAGIYSAKWSVTAIFSAMLSLFLVMWFGLEWWKALLAAAPVLALALVIPDAPTVSFTAGVIGLSFITGTKDGQLGNWFEQTWGFAKQILPLLLIGVLVAGALLGRPGHEGLIPSEWIRVSVGGNSLRANFLSSVVGAFMYFATLTEIPILEGLIGNGMGKGPALALLLAGPALSLPSMLVIRSVMGTKKTVVFVGLVILMATVTGLLFGNLFP
ncbi:MAG: permease, partial [bacterium]